MLIRKVLIMLMALSLLLLINIVICNSVSSVNHTEQSIPAEMSLSDFGINGVIIGSSELVAIEKFEGPVKFENGIDKFPNLEIILHKQYNATIIAIVVKGGSYKTYRGIGVGATESDVLRLYGKTEKYNNRLSYFWSNGIWQYQIDFLIKNGKVAEIKIFRVD